MRSEHIRAVDTWRGGPGRYDTIFININSSVEGICGFDSARVRLFFHLHTKGTEYPRALLHWFSRVSISPDENMGMWEMCI